MNLRKRFFHSPDSVSEEKEEKKKGYTLAIRFAKDAHLMLIDDVEESGFYQTAPNIFYFTKNGHSVFCNMNELLYAGPADLLGDK